MPQNRTNQIFSTLFLKIWSVINESLTKQTTVGQQESA